jgi:hypothetical protein
MSILGRVRRALAGHPSGDHDRRSAALEAIAQAGRQRELAARMAATTLVTHAQLERAIAQQHRLLAAARDQIRTAVQAADRAADAARADGGPAAATPYELTARRLGEQLELVQAALTHLEQLRGATRQNVDRAQQLLRGNAARLDDALRAEVQLLGRLEHLDRERAKAEAMRRHHRAGDPPSGQPR